MEEVSSIFRALPPQWACINSKAKIRGYGGAMGGGKSRTGCEIVFDEALDYPGLVAVVAQTGPHEHCRDDEEDDDQSGDRPIRA